MSPGLTKARVLPSYAAFFSDGRACHPKTGHLSPWSGPYGAGFTNAIFEASEFVNVGGTFVPKRFQFALFRPRWGGTNSNELWVGAKWQGVAESIQIDHSGGVALPRILSNTFVHDYRTEAPIMSGRVEYGITNKRWIAVNEPAFKKAEVRAEQRYQHKRTAGVWSREIGL